MDISAVITISALDLFYIFSNEEVTSSLNNKDNVELFMDE